MGDETSFTVVRYINSTNRMVPIFAIYVLRTIFWSVAGNMLVYTLLKGEVAGWCCSLLPWLHYHGRGVVDNTRCYVYLTTVNEVSSPI